MTTNVALVGLARDLAARAETGKPIRIGLIGAGEMGTDIVTQVARMQGIEVGALSARRLPNTFKAVRTAYGDEDNAQETATQSAMTRAIEAGKIAVTDDNDLILSNSVTKMKRISIALSSSMRPAFRKWVRRPASRPSATASTSS